MASPQTENGFLKIANEIWDEVIRRDFSKRQKDILLFIWRLSYGCGKKKACIPRLKNFELCGVSPQNITKELKYLSSCKVIFWEKEESIFTVNKDYEQWQISPVKGWDEDDFKELISLNISKKTSQNKKFNTSQNKKFSGEKQSAKLLYTSQNKKWLLLKIRSLDFLKQEVRSLSIPWGCKVKWVSKDSIKYNIKDISSSTKILNTNQDTEELNDRNDHSYERLIKIYQDNFTVDRIVKPLEMELFGGLFDDYGGKWLLEAMRETYRQSPDKRTLAYVEGVLKGYQSRGSSDPDPNRQRGTPTKYQQQIDELDKFIEEENRRGAHRNSDVVQDD